MDNSSVNKYLSEALNGAHENFASADGFFDEAMQFTGREDFFNATGSQVSSGPAPTSQPYIIVITNTAGAYANLSILGSFLYSGPNTATWTAGSQVVTNGAGTITISSGIPGITYQQMLYQFMTNPFSVGLTYFQSTTAGQVLETISVNTRDANGNLAQKTFVPTIDPYQQQTDITVMKYGYRIDGYTQLIINSILASATVRLYLYPSDNINLARGLSGQQVSSQFKSPGIIKAQPIALTTA